MNVFAQFLDDPGRQPTQGDRARSEETWAMHGQQPEARLLAFDTWVRRQLERRLVWDWAGAQKARRIEQCRIKLEGLVLDLWRRGWMLDGRRLASHLEGVLDTIGRYQRAGRVIDFWSYFSATVDRYVGANAEEIREEALRAGSHVQQLLGALGMQAPGNGPALPELIAQRADEVGKAKAETLRQKLARARAQKKSVDAQLPLL